MVSPDNMKKSDKVYQIVNNVHVPMNCFLGNTSYANQFVSSGMAQKISSIRPPNNNMVSHKFRAVSSYKSQFGNSEEAHGRNLIASTQE